MRWSLGIVLAIAATSTQAQENSEDLSELRDYLSANGLLNRGLYELAEKDYEKFLSERPRHEKAPVARYGLSVCLFRQGRHDRAVEQLEPLVRLKKFEFAAEVKTMLGQSCVALRRYEEAVRIFDQTIEHHGDHPLADDAQAGGVEAAYRLGNYADAARRCQAFVKDHPESPLKERVWFFWGLASAAQEDHGDAARRFGAFRERYPDSPLAERATLLLAQCQHRGGALKQAADTYRILLENRESPHVAEALLGLGRVLRQMKQPNESGAALDRLINDHPRSELLTDAKFERGLAWFDQEKYAAAFDLFTQVPAKGHDLSDDAAYWAGKCKLRSGAFDEAAKLLAHAAERFPDGELQPEMRYDRALSLTRGGHEEAAMEALADFRRTFPEHVLAPDALQLEATLRHQAGAYDESMTLCRAFMAKHESHPAAATIQFLTAENDFLSGRYEEAEKNYRAFLARFADDDRGAQARYRLGMALYRLERFDEAQPLLERSADASTSDFRASFLALGDLAFQRGEWTSAQRYFSDYLKNGAETPPADDALLKLGLCLQRQQRFDQALEAYDHLIQRFPESPHRLQAAFERGQALVALNRIDEAVQAFTHVVETKTDENRFAPYAFNHLGALALKKGDPREASTWFARAVESAPEDALKAQAMFQQGQALSLAEMHEPAEKVYREFLARFPKHERASRAASQRAIALARLKRSEDALRAVALAKTDYGAGLTPEARQQLDYEEAWLRREAGQMDQAKKAYQAVLTDPPPGRLTAHALLEWGELEASEKNHEAALSHLQKLHDMARSEADSVPPEVAEPGLYRLAVCEFELGRFPDAAKSFKLFIQNYPESAWLPSACFFCGEALIKIDDPEGAVRQLSRVVESYPSDEAAGPALLRLGEALATLQRWSRSEKAFADYLDRFADAPTWYQARFGIGWARENQNRHAEAVEAYREVVDRHQGPTAARAQFQIGECYFARREYEQAVREFLKVDILYAYPEWSAAALYEAGQCFEKLDKAIEARKHFELVIQKHGQTRWAELASQRLKALASSSIAGR